MELLAEWIVMRKMCAWLVVLLPISCFAETPFAGTWVVQPQATEYSLRPLSFMIERGTYKRASCAPDVEVPTSVTGTCMALNETAMRGVWPV